MRRLQPHQWRARAEQSAALAYWVLFDLILAAVAEGDGSAIALVGERLKLLREEGMSATWDTLYAAWAYCQSVGDTAGARKWAARAAESAQFGLGRDSSEFQKYTACAR
eukprot:620435-Prymnesium_polylepis.2